MHQLFPTAGDVDPADAYGRLAAFGPSRPGVRLNMIASVDGADLARAVSALAKRGHTNVLSEGGPGVAAQLAAGGARRILDGAALAPPSVLALGQVLEADGYQFLRYRRR